MSSKSDMEEERRLFYVALTRAMQRVTLTYATSRFRWGNLTYCEPSRFIEEIDEKYLNQPVGIKTLPSSKNEEQRTYRTDPPKDHRKRNLVKVERGPSNDISDEMKSVMENVGVGSRVYHDRFGKGTVILLEGDVLNQKATIEFENKGKKQLLLRFAKLKIFST